MQMLFQKFDVVAVFKLKCCCYFRNWMVVLFQKFDVVAVLKKLCCCFKNLMQLLFFFSKMVMLLF